jgi:hypothetical protein
MLLPYGIPRWNRIPREAKRKKKIEEREKTKNIQGGADAARTCSETRTVSLPVRLPLVSREPNGCLTVKQSEAGAEV